MISSALARRRDTPCARIISLAHYALVVPGCWVRGSGDALGYDSNVAGQEVAVPAADITLETPRLTLCGALLGASKRASARYGAWPAVQGLREAQELLGQLAHVGGQGGRYFQALCQFNRAQENSERILYLLSLGMRMRPLVD